MICIIFTIERQSHEFNLGLPFMFNEWQNVRRLIADFSSRIRVLKNNTHIFAGDRIQTDIFPGRRVEKTFVSPVYILTPQVQDREIFIFPVAQKFLLELPHFI